MSEVEPPENEADDAEPTSEEDVELPQEHRAAIEALPDDMVQIMFDGLLAGKSDDEIRADIEAAKKKP
jgi:hypothetical protein